MLRTGTRATAARDGRGALSYSARDDAPPFPVNARSTRDVASVAIPRARAPRARVHRDRSRASLIRGDVAFAASEGRSDSSSLAITGRGTCRFLRAPRGFLIPPRGLFIPPRGFLVPPRGLFVPPRGSLNRPRGSSVRPRGFLSLPRCCVVLARFGGRFARRRGRPFLRHLYPPLIFIGTADLFAPPGRMAVATDAALWHPWKEDVRSTAQPRQRRRNITRPERVIYGYD